MGVCQSIKSIKVKGDADDLGEDSIINIDKVGKKSEVNKVGKKGEVDKEWLMEMINPVLARRIKMPKNAMRQSKEKQNAKLAKLESQLKRLFHQATKKEDNEEIYFDSELDEGD
jgi:hypothetical protein